jgi:hypothetical protein
MILSIYDSTNDIHPWWDNFVNSLNIEDIAVSYYFPVMKSCIAKELTSHNGKLLMEPDISIEFENEEYATLFLLRFS